MCYRMSCRFLAVALMFLIALVGASAANATPPVRTFFTSSPMLLTGFCPFPVQTNDRVDGAPTRETVFFDKNGNVSRVVDKGSVISTLTNVDTGASITVRNSGSITVTFNQDGTITLTQTGPDITGDQGIITGRPFLTLTKGRVVATGVPDPTTGFVDFSSVTMTGRVTDLCAALS